MKEKDVKIHHNNLDIVQRLMAETLKGHQPLKVFGLETSKVKEVLSTDLPALETIDDKADTLYLLEDGDFLHVEYQSSWKTEDLFRFAGYSLRIYNKINKKSLKENPQMQTVVIFSPSVTKEKVEQSFDYGAMKYNIYPIFLGDLEKGSNVDDVLDKIKENPKTSLTEVEQMRLVYRPLFKKETEQIQNEAYYIIRNLNRLQDDSLKAHLSGMVYVLTRRFLNEEGEKKIWEVLSKMTVVEQELKKRYGFDAGKQEARSETFDGLVEAIKKNVGDSGIEILIKLGKFSEEEVKEAYRLAGK